jgi:hypothetical protein
MDLPGTRYARSGDVSIAYQVLGEGPFDVVITPGAISHVELQWETAGWTALLRGAAGPAPAPGSALGMPARRKLGQSRTTPKSNGSDTATHRCGA